MIQLFTRRAEVGLAGGSNAIRYSLMGARHSTNGILAFNNAFTTDVLSGALRVTGSSAVYGSARWHAPIRLRDASAGNRRATGKVIGRPSPLHFAARR